MKILLIDDNSADVSFVKELFGRFKGVHCELVNLRSSSGITGTGRIQRRRSAGQGIRDAH